MNKPKQLSMFTECFNGNELSLYSTATQNYSRWVLASAWTPNATLLRHLTQNIPTCWYILALPNATICVSPDTKLKSCVSPDANPRRQSVEYRWRWAFWHWGWPWSCTFHVVYVNFICVGHPMQTRFSVEYERFTFKYFLSIGMKLSEY